MSYPAGLIIFLLAIKYVKPSLLKATSSGSCAPSETTAYYDWLKKRSKNYKKDQFIARKGDILLWHGQLIHGGDAVVNPSLTRKSYVCHYIPAERNMHHQVTGPFNW